MDKLLVFLIIVIAVVFDYFWLDREGKRWSWTKNWTKFQKGLLFSAFLILAAITYMLSYLTSSTP
ncbi:hypothetical protein [Oceanobacillus profundus]|uniref:Uncharacterized protein n=1 Tax=Oceanobacillus profundus TaxID=372463 RepID=A0A417YIT3_9BACI|nr:hypothetical protein [Oceanobacillus profundus]MCM3400229.1 hypothetical protein [Oceanobacillus profundus]MDO6448341.1 hypothetical protein [Oceanobacillus profundus]PAE30932.1 hypothetical protein CHI07_01535 [Paenibacillus sp. 7884-2]RHW32976.1 hypothetical protein D1B32_07970 [Oceanobacillus profundus]